MATGPEHGRTCDPLAELDAPDACELARQEIEPKNEVGFASQLEDHPMAGTLKTLASFAAGLLTLGATALADDHEHDQAQQMPMMGQGMGMMGDCPMMGGGMGEMRQGMPGGMAPGMMGQHMGPGMMMSRGPMMEGRLAYLKAELGITDSQASSWDGYVAAVKERADSMQKMHATMMQAMNSGTAAERMNTRIKHMEAMLDALKIMKPATEALYKALSDDQKKKADVLLGMGCCMM
ncbi:MAG: Spy/CpxP family protein refolding chaperone [Hyphomicrobium sp.]|nr:Spy/CpxP family protein refolding chaperone [Hyphomicrobium sp.]